MGSSGKFGKCVIMSVFAVSGLTGVSGQGVVGRSSAGQSKTFGCLSTSSSPGRALRGFDLCAKFSPNDSQKDDGSGLFTALLVRVGDLLRIWREVRQTTLRERRREYCWIV